MRLFTGISIPADVAVKVRALIDRLTPLAALRWSPIADLHITTKFVGEQPDTRVGEIERALGALAPRDPFLLTVRGIGWFPNPDVPRVFWAGVEAPVGLAELAADTERALATFRIAMERRPYSPHVTLARVPTGARLRELRQELGALPSTEFGAFTVDRFTLYESRLADSLAHYHPLVSFMLSRPSQGRA